MTNSVVLKPVDVNFTLKDHIYGVLRDAILKMDIYDKDADLRLDERQIAEQLGISRTPIREALARLEQEGLVAILPRRGVYIRRKDLDEVLELITVWAALESMAARLACERATDAEIAELRRVGRRYTKDKAKANISEYSEANIEFHLCILGMSQCKKLQEIAEGVFTHLKPVRRKAMKDQSRADRSVVDHTNIIEAIEDRNADLAGELVREHTMRLHDYLRRAWKIFVDEEATT